MENIAQEKELFVLNSLVKYDLLNSLVETLSNEDSKIVEDVNWTKTIKYNFDLPQEFVKEFEETYNSSEEEIGVIISNIIDKAISQYLENN